MGGPFYANPKDPTPTYPKMPRHLERKQAANAAAWALGQQQRNGFHSPLAISHTGTCSASAVTGHDGVVG
jgi:hypothetical protein